MNNPSRTIELAEQLAERIHSMDSTTHAGIFGTANTDNVLLQVRKAAAELLHYARQGAAIRTSIKQLEAELLTAQLVGLLSQSELEKILVTVDELYAITDKET